MPDSLSQWTPLDTIFLFLALFFQRTREGNGEMTVACPIVGCIKRVCTIALIPPPSLIQEPSCRVLQLLLRPGSCLFKDRGLAHSQAPTHRSPTLNRYEQIQPRSSDSFATLTGALPPSGGYPDDMAARFEAHATLHEIGTDVQTHTVITHTTRAIGFTPFHPRMHLSCKNNNCRVSITRPITLGVGIGWF